MELKGNFKPVKIILKHGSVVITLTLYIHHLTNQVFELTL